MKLLVLIILFVLSPLLSTLSAQTAKSEELIRKGVRMHDRGRYKEAVDYYQKALEFNPTSMSAIYEMSLSYLKMKDYNRALKYSSKVIEANFTPLLNDAYTVKGTALVEEGKIDEAIKLFKSAIERAGDEYLLHFNLGLCYFNKKDNERAIDHLRHAIEIDATHASAFLLYAYALNDSGKWVESFYSFQFFLLLEPNTDRSKDAFGEMYDLLNKDYSSEKGALLPENGVDRRQLHRVLASKRIVSSDPKLQYTSFVEASKIILFRLSQLNDKNQNSLLWSFFVPTFAEILNSGYFETYSRYISVSYFPESLTWWNSNQAEADRFIEWFEVGQASVENGEETIAGASDGDDSDTEEP